MITFNEYKEHLINYYRYPIDSTKEKRLEREFHLKRQYDDETLKKIINDTYDFVIEILECDTINFNYYDLSLIEDNSFGISLLISGGGYSDYIYVLDDKRMISDYILKKIFGKSLIIEVKCDEIERECEEDILSFDYYYHFYLQGFPNNLDEIKEELSRISIKNKIILGTGSYSNVKSGNTVSITGDGGNAWGYFGPSYKKMSPKLYLWQYYDQNPEHLSEEELIDWYINEFYNLRLKGLKANDLLATLKERFGENIVLLCHELPGLEINKEHFCHRRLLANWIELETGIIIPEVSIDLHGNVKAEKIYDLKPRIKKLIKTETKNIK